MHAGGIISKSKLDFWIVKIRILYRISYTPYHVNDRIKVGNTIVTTMINAKSGT